MHAESVTAGETALKSMKEKFIIRCRETGLFYHPGFVGPVLSGPWVPQPAARRFDKTNAEWYAAHLEQIKHCVHVVPADWAPAVEADPLKVRVRNFFVAIYHFFKH